MADRNEEIMALYAEVKRLKTENDELRLFKIKAVEEAKREADSLMINKILKYEDEIRKLKGNINDEDIIIKEFDYWNQANNWINKNFKKIGEGNYYNYYYNTKKIKECK